MWRDSYHARGGLIPLRANLDSQIPVERQGGYLVPAKVDDPRNVHRNLVLDGQEFLRFRGCWTPDDVAQLGEEWGSLRLGMQGAFKGKVPEPGQDDWLRLLTNDPTGYDPTREPIADWIRLSGLMDFAVGLLRLSRHESGRSELKATLNRGSVGPWDIERLKSEYAGHEWLLAVLGGAARMNMSVQMGNGNVLCRSLDPPRRTPRGDSLLEDFDVSFPLTAEGIAGQLVSLAAPWLLEVAPTLKAEGTRILLAYDLPHDLLSTLWLQFANALTEGMELQLCAWDRCPGPPSRGRAFLWRERRTGKYCSTRCAKSAGMARSRQTKKGAKK